MSVSLLKPLSGLGRPIDGDRPCHSCGYNLRGLKYGDRCPECGTPARVTRQHEGARITDAPMAYLTRLAGGAALLAAGAWGVLASIIWTHAPARTAMTAALLAASLVPWAVGVFIVTSPRPPQPGRTQPPEEEWKKLRMMARVTQVAGLVPAVFYLSGCLMEARATAIAAAGGTVANTLATEIAFWMSRAGFVILWCSAFSVTTYLSRLADWADDEELVWKLRGALLWMIPAYGLGLVARALWMGALGPLRFTSASLFTAGCLACVFFAAWPFTRFAHLASWATTNTRTSLARDRSVSARIVKRIEDGQSKPNPGGEPKPVVAHKPTRPQGYYMPPAAKGPGYEVAPDPVEKPKTV